jgi:hypothetical protein
LAGVKVETKIKWLRRAGLIVGLAGAVALIVWGLFNAEGGLSGSAFPSLIIFYVAPLLIGVVIAWNWPLAGGIALVAIGLSWLIFIFVLVFSEPIAQSITSLALSMFVIIAPITLPPLATGILFLLYWRAKRAYQARKKS